MSNLLIDWIYRDSFKTPSQNHLQCTMPQTEPETTAATVRVEKAVAVLDR